MKSETFPEQVRGPLGLSRDTNDGQSELSKMDLANVLIVGLDNGGDYDPVDGMLQDIAAELDMLGLLSMSNADPGPCFTRMLDAIKRRVIVGAELHNRIVAALRAERTTTGGGAQ
jgi:hypothetical protein